MLAKPNRVVRADDFRMTMRRGRRVATAHTVVHITQRDVASAARFGFVISKAVGGSVERNRLRRRLRAISAELLASGYRGTDVVVRALPGSADLAWNELRSEVAPVITAGGTR